MYGNSGKLGRGGGGGGRGGGGGGGKRNIHSTFHPPSLHRPSSATAPGGRLSMGGGGAGPRNQTVSAPAPPSFSSAATEETFSLVSGNPLNFAMIIRLAPDLVEQIKQVEAQGGTARIKFDANANNPAGNVINVGGKDFRFTWSPETGDLCDIYEERQSGEDGNGLLIESGCAWRKLNVQRVLDESTKNHVKMRSEEAERKHKSRKAIVLEHGNPSMKSQMKALAAAESNPWRMPIKQKKEQHPFKKRKAEPPPATGPPKSVYKSGMTTTTPSKGKAPTSSPSSPIEQGAPTSPFGSANLTKAHANAEDISSTHAVNKSISTEKDMAGRGVKSAVQEKPGGKGIKGAQPADLRSMLISLLMENPSKGMSLKALEKAIGDAIPNSVRQIEPILKKIATFQAPGRYFLKPGVEMESSKKPLSEGQSSLDDDHHQSPKHEKYDEKPTSETSFPMSAETKELEARAQLGIKSEEALKHPEKVDVQHPTVLFGERKISDNSEGPIGSTSDSGSDSDSESESSDSGSDSGSHSRSRSRSRSGSSSDSDTDASTNSKEVSDVEVDIMTSDDDKEVKHKLQASGLESPKSPILWGTMDGVPDHNGLDEKQEGHVSEVVEIEKDLPDDEHVSKVAAIVDTVPDQKAEKPFEETEPAPQYHLEREEIHKYLRKDYSIADKVSKDGFNHEQSGSSEKISRSKYKRPSDDKHLDDKPDRTKKLKAGNLNQQQISGSKTAAFMESHQDSSPGRPFEDPPRGPNLHMASKTVRDDNTGFGLQKGYNQTIAGKSMSDSQQPGRSIDPSARAKTSAAVERPGKHSENMGRSVKHLDRSLKMNEGFPMQKDKFIRETKDDRFPGAMGPVTYSKDGFGEKHTAPVDSLHIKHETFFGSVSTSQIGNSPKDEGAYTMNRATGNGRSKVLQRELSDLELGELREPLPEEKPGLTRQTEKKGSFKQSQNKPLSSEDWNSGSSKGKPSGKITTDSAKSSPLDSNIPVSGIPEGISKKGDTDHAEDISRPFQRVTQVPHRPHQSRVDPGEAGAQCNRVVEFSGRNRPADAGRSLETAPEVQGKPQKKVPTSAPFEHEAKRGAIPPPGKESRRQKSNTISDINDKQKDASLTGSSDGGQKRRESSDENSCSYSKYEKDEPELKGPIKDFSQYKDYVEEYQEKYEVYISLNNILESYREEFLQYGRDLEASKGKDMDRYREVERQIKESYRQCGERHKRLKKTFLVLHEELQNVKQKIEEFAAPYLKDQ